MRVFLSNWIFLGWIVLWALLLSIPQTLPLEDSPTCDAERQYEHEGRCCTKCEPGLYMSAKCTALSETTCMPCDTDEYMEHWNVEDRCEKQIYCDPGKGFIEDHPHSVKAKVNCTCKPGYHCSETCEFCQRDTECPPGHGVKHAADKHDDTHCEPCSSGYFSNVSSSLEKCMPWTNCTTIGKTEHISGTETSDAVCLDYPHQVPDKEDKVWIVLLASILSAGIVAAFILLIICYRRNGKSLSAGLYHWLNEVCSRKYGSQDPFHNEPPLHITKHENSEGICLLTRNEEKRLSQGTGCICGLCGGELTGSSCCSSESEQSMGEDKALAPFPQRGPTEDEYVEVVVSPHCSVPVEIGENGDFSQHVSVLQSFPNSGDGDCGLETSCRTDCHHLPDRSLSEAMENVAPSVLTGDSFNCSCGSFESSRQTDKRCDNTNNFRTETGASSSENGSSPQCSCGMDFKNVPFNSPKSGVGEDQPFDSTGSFQSSTRNMHDSKYYSCDPPTASGTVSGTSNTTFISSGQVMNFKGEVIVVYLSQNSLDTQIVTERTAENLGCPVQEENPNYNKSFAGKPQETKETYIDINLCYPLQEREPTGNEGTTRDAGLVPCESHNFHNSECCQNAISFPVQEEGKPEHLSKEECNC